MRRRIFVVFMVVLFCALSWHATLSLALKGAVRLKMGSQLAFRELCVRNWKIVLEDAVIFDTSGRKSTYHLRIERIEIALTAFEKPLKLDIVFTKPHLSLLEGFATRASKIKQSSSKWIDAQIAFNEGTFEWRDGAADPLFGHFSFKEAEGLRLQMGDGSLTAHFTTAGSEKRIDCCFDRWKIAPIASHFTTIDLQGNLSGSLHLAMKRRALERLSGHLDLHQFAFSSKEWDAVGGADLLEWEGDCTTERFEHTEWLDAIFPEKGCWPKRMKLELHGAHLARGGSHLEKLEGMFSSNRGAGLRWELNGPFFNWEGKGFSQSRQSNWLESHCQLGEAKGKFSIVQSELTRSLWSIEWAKADARFVQLIENLSFVEWPCRMEKGIVSARLEWEERMGSLAEWKLEQFVASDLCLRSKEWFFQCAETNGSAACSGNERMAFQGLFALSGGSGQFDKWSVQDLQTSGKIADGLILKGGASASVNCLAVKADFKGSLQKTLAEMQVKGPWGQYWSWLNPSECDQQIESAWQLEGDWNGFSARVNVPFSVEESILAKAEIVRTETGWSLTKAVCDTHNLDLARLKPLLSLDCRGLADTQIRYDGNELNLCGTAAHFAVQTELGTLSIDKLSAVQATWDTGSREWAAQTGRVLGECAVGSDKIPFEGQFEWDGELLNLSIEKGRFAEVEFSGDWQFAFEENVPFLFTAAKLDGQLGTLARRFGGFDGIEGHLFCSANCFQMRGDLFQDPATWHWQGDATLSGLQWGPLKNAKAQVSLDSALGLLECTNASGTLEVGDAAVPVRSAELRKQDDAWIFDFRAEHRFWDLARLAGSAAKRGEGFAVDFDSKKSHLFGSPLEFKQSLLASSKGELESLSLSHRLSWNALLAAAPCLQNIHSLLQPMLSEPIQGACLLQLDLACKGTSSVQILGEGLQWKKEPVALSLKAHKDSKNPAWEIDRLQLGDLGAKLQLIQEGNRYKIAQGELNWGDGLTVGIKGNLGPSLKGELEVEKLSADLQKVLSPYWPGLQGAMDGTGTISLEWNGDLAYEADLALTSSGLKSGSFNIDNPEPIQLHFSKRQGLLIRGLDLSVHNPAIDWPVLHGRIGLMQFDFARQHWVLHHSQMSLPADSFSLLRRKLDEQHPLSVLFASLDSQHDLEFAADFDCAADFSSLTCSMREGFIPFLGAVRHLQNVNFAWDPSGFRTTLQALHQGHSLKMGAHLQLEPHPSGRIVLEDEEYPLSEGERPLVVEWEMDPSLGLVIHSIEGTCGGLEASFHAEVNQDAGSLIGSARLHFGSLSEILPSDIAKVFRQLKMGKGFELKGRLLYERDHPSAVGFKGLLSGKTCELFGFQIRTLQSLIEVDSTRVRLSEIKASDAAGILKIDDLLMSQAPNEPWRISMPVLKMLEFRPSLLQKVGRDPGPVGPLVVRELKMTEFEGQLDDSLSYRAKGDLSFINSFKREHTVFDLPADFLGRIFGLDLELLIPVKGKLKFELEEGRFWLDDLQDAYSEGKRSKFFLVSEGLSPTIDLDGNLNILIKMKQYVLFKITENFLLSIDGSLENPGYHLQKKSKILGL